MTDEKQKWGAIKIDEKTSKVELLDLQKILVKQSRKYYVKFLRFFLESAELNYLLENVDDTEELNDFKKIAMEMSSKFCEISKDIMDVSHTLDVSALTSLVRKILEEFNDN